MQKKIFFSLLLIMPILLQAQGAKFAAYQKFLVPELCECMQSNPNLSAKTVLFAKMDTCVWQILFKSRKEVEEIVPEFNFEENLSDYDKGKKIGKLLIYHNINEMVAQCPFYVASIKQYIKDEKAKLGGSTEKVDATIATFTKLVSEAENDTQRYFAYQLLGILYYIKESYSESLMYFEKTSAIQSSTTIKGFIEMIKQYDLK
ncbi:MAG: hypothetical protein RLZZ292_2409 [Bacteroidota bacterium]|jgi:tetratricopeptide (TPR) repeat protein